MVPTPNLKKDSEVLWDIQQWQKEFYHELYLLCGSHQILFPK